LSLANICKTDPDVVRVLSLVCLNITATILMFSTNTAYPICLNNPRYMYVNVTSKFAITVHRPWN